jgi:hypothetical protein
VRKDPLNSQSQHRRLPDNLKLLPGCRRCTIDVPFRDAFERPGGIVSGQVFMAAADVATWLAIKTKLGKGDRAGTNPFPPSFSSSTVGSDWRVLGTVDTLVGAAISTDPSQPLDSYPIPGVVTGDHGTAHFPFTIPSAGPWSVGIFVVNGGKVAIDNVTITQGNVGPWRRDFENGFVLVNPLAQPHTFSAADLAGALNRTNIRRIKGTQAPDVNNGQTVAGSLTLNSFDAIILLAGHVATPPAPTAPPAISGIESASAFGAFPSVSPGSWAEIYGSNLSATTRSLPAPISTALRRPRRLME